MSETKQVEIDGNTYFLHVEDAMKAGHMFRKLIPKIGGLYGFDDKVYRLVVATIYDDEGILYSGYVGLVNVLTGDNWSGFHHVDNINNITDKDWQSICDGEGFDFLDDEVEVKVMKIKKKVSSNVPKS